MTTLQPSVLVLSSTWTAQQQASVTKAEKARRRLLLLCPWSLYQGLLGMPFNMLMDNILSDWTADAGGSETAKFNGVDVTKIPIQRKSS